MIRYFSLTTLSTVGFGDITPVTLQARYAAVAEGITGQFYLAILVARSFVRNFFAFCKRVVAVTRPLHTSWGRRPRGALRLPPRTATVAGNPPATGTRNLRNQLVDVQPA